MANVFAQPNPTLGFVIHYLIGKQGTLHWGIFSVRLGEGTFACGAPVL